MCDSFLYTLLSSLTKLCASPINHKALSRFQVCICYFLYLESFSPLIFSIWKTSIPYFRSSSNSALYIEDYSSFPKQVTLSTGIPQIFLEKIIVFIYLFLVVQGLHSCSGFSLVKRKQGLLSSCRVWASLVTECWLWGVLALVTTDTGAHSSWFPGSRAQSQELWHKGLVAPKHVGSSRIRDSTHVSCIGRQILYP